MSNITFQERIEKPLHRRPDLCAFLMLDSVSDESAVGRDLISAAEHDVIFLDVDPDAIAAKLSDDQLRDLVRCGIRYDSDNDYLSMFA